jgi:uncharacterized protein
MPWDFALILVLLIVVVPLLGRRRVRQLMAMPETTKALRLRLYASTVIFQWIAAAGIFWRSRAHGISLRHLGLAIPSVVLAAAVALLLSGPIFVNQIFSLRRITQHPNEAAGVLPQLALKIFPRDASEHFAFTVLVFTVAICEEFIYRGFVQYIFGAISRSVIAAVVASAVIFALAHLYQGRRGVIATFVVGVLFASTRAWTGSLIPSVVAHFVADLSAGFLAPSFLRKAKSLASSAIAADR